jgi:hypothetical protein
MDKVIVKPSPKLVNIRQLSSWIAGSINSQNDKFLLRPTDLKILYQLFLWTYLNNIHEGEITPETVFEQITDDASICIPEESLLRLVQIYFNNNNRQYFNTIINM